MKNQSSKKIDPVRLDVRLAFCIKAFGVEKVRELLSDIKIAHKEFSKAYQNFDPKVENYRDIVTYHPQFKGIIDLIFNK